jgi:hypothetical protein
MSGHAIHITVDGRKHAATFTVDRKHLTVSTTYGKKTAEVDPKVQHHTELTATELDRSNPGTSTTSSIAWACRSEQ